MTEKRLKVLCVNYNIHNSLVSQHSLSCMCSVFITGDILYANSSKNNIVSKKVRDSLFQKKTKLTLLGTAVFFQNVKSKIN